VPTPTSVVESAETAEAACAALPEAFRKLCEGVIIRVDDFPTDEVLEEIASRRPRSRPEIDAVAGLGPARRNRFADELLAVIARAEAVR